jgi:hypothetical protein
MFVPEPGAFFFGVFASIRVVPRIIRPFLLKAGRAFLFSGKSFQN